MATLKVIPVLINSAQSYFTEKWFLSFIKTKFRSTTCYNITLIGVYCFTREEEMRSFFKYFCEPYWVANKKTEKPLWVLRSNQIIFIGLWSSLLQCAQILKIYSKAIECGLSFNSEMYIQPLCKVCSSGVIHF